MDFKKGDRVMYIGDDYSIFQNKECTVVKICGIFLEIKFDLNSSDIFFVNSKYYKKISYQCTLTTE